MINDWIGQQQNPKYLPNVLDVYLRRALGVNPRMVFVFVYLWAPLAAVCFPVCDMGHGQKFIWKAVVPHLAQYEGDLDLTHIDFNDIAAQHTVADTVEEGTSFFWECLVPLFSQGVSSLKLFQ